MRPAQSAPEDYPRAQLTLAAVSLEFGLPDLRTKKGQRGSPQVCFARQVAMYLLHVTYNINQTRTAQLFSRDRSTVSHACTVVEDSRDDPVFDQKITRLEAFLAQSPDLSGAELC